MLITNAPADLNNIDDDGVDTFIEADGQPIRYTTSSNRTTDLDIGHHNVSDLLESLSLEQRAYYSRKYDQRAPEQVATREGVIMTWEKPAAATLRHMRYRSELTRQVFYVASPEGVCDLNGMPVALPELIAGRSLRIKGGNLSASSSSMAASTALDHLRFRTSSNAVPLASPYSMDF